MIFFHPMWDSENQRLGLKSCAPLGYTIVGIGGLIGMLGFLALITVLVYLAYKQLVAQFSSGLLWLLLIPIGMGVLGRVMYGWALAIRKQFSYDDTRTARWKDGGEIRSFPPKGKAAL
jgi:hypothetical protein